MPVIEFKGVTFTYSGANKPAIREIRLGINKGEFVVLTGPSGCGKTTLCRCINGLIPHFYAGELKGEVEVAGLDVWKSKVSELARHVGFVFQNPENQLFTLVVEKDVAFGLENLAFPRDEIRKRVDWALSMTGIEGLRFRAPYELSGGEKQRAAIASVLAMRPEIIVLDEPTSFVDPLTAERIFEVVHKLQEELFITVVLVEHRLSMLTKFADRVLVMDNGRIVLDGVPEKVFVDERVKSIGVEVPRAVSLYQLLRRDGVHLLKVPMTPSSFASELKGVLRDRSQRCDV